MRNEFFELLYEKFQHNKDFILITADLGYGLLDKFFVDFPERVFNMGITEQSIVSVAAGIALHGKKVFIYSIANFLTLRVIEQLRNDVLFHSLNVIILNGGGGYSYGNLGFTHHSTEDISILRALPNLSIYAPSSMNELIYTMDEVVGSSKPAYVRLFKSSKKNLTLLGNCESVCDGVVSYFEGDIAIVYTGGTLKVLLEEISKFKHYKNKFKLYSVFKLKPFKDYFITQILIKHNLIITLEDNNLEAGFGSLLLEIFNEYGLDASNLKRFGISDRYETHAGDADYLFRKNILENDKFHKFISNYLVKIGSS